MIKFYRIFKKLIVLCLILIQPITSYATTVSDGSNFVTKSELSADLNSLSNRISKLENSIDAKIDSLVSAYLNKNGIWNGEKQTLHDGTHTTDPLEQESDGTYVDYTKWKYGFGSSDSSKSKLRENISWNTSYDVTVFKRTVYSENLYRVVPYDTKVVSGKIVNNITKTGLAIVNTSCSDATTTDGRCYLADSSDNNDGRLHEDNFLFIYNAKISFSQNDVVLNSVEMQQIEQFANVYLTIKPMPAVVMLMFVEKNKPLYVKYENSLDNVVYYSTGAATVGCTLSWMTRNKESSYRTWQVDDITIY